jgi:hypothetical protein
MTELVTIDILVDRPVPIDSRKVIKVHPKNTIIFLFKELQLFSDIIRPFIGFIRPIAFPFATSPRVS